MGHYEECTGVEFVDSEDVTVELRAVFWGKRPIFIDDDIFRIVIPLDDLCS